MNFKEDKKNYIEIYLDSNVFIYIFKTDEVLKFKEKIDHI